MECLAKGESIVVFPEGTYNCSPNRLVLPIHGGVVDIAKKMQVPIVPVVQEYEFDNSKVDGIDRVKSCTVRFGKPINVNYDDNYYEKTRELRDSLATIRFNLIEDKGIYSRKKIKQEEYESYLLSRIKIYDDVNENYLDETSTIYGADNYIYQDYPINGVNVNKILKLVK